VSYPWLPASRRTNAATVTVEVSAGRTVRVRYTARLLQFLPGKLRVDERLPEARVVP
jgi:hypothetical protein